MIYHITRAGEWERARGGRFYQPAGFEAEGFIHCCEADFIETVGNRYFRGQSGLVILCIDPGKVRASIRYEDLVGGGVLFPHVYGELNVDAVVEVVAFEADEEGRFSSPFELV